MNSNKDSHQRLCYVNGQFVKYDEARLPIDDRGFRFGDSVFETVPVHQGVGYQWQWHLSRLQDGLDAVAIACPEDDLKQVARTLLQRNNIRDGFVRIQVSRGVGSAGYSPIDGITPTLVMETLERKEAPLVPYVLYLSQWKKPPLSCLPVQHKLGHGLNSTLALLEAEQHHCDDSLICTMENHPCETASANLFWIKDHKIYTPSLQTGCLNGATREVLLRLAKIEALSTATLDTLRKADAVFMTNVRLGIHPVERIEPQGWTFDPQHPIIKQLRQAYHQDIEHYVTDHQSDWH